MDAVLAFKSYEFHVTRRSLFPRWSWAGWKGGANSGSEVPGVGIEGGLRTPLMKSTGLDGLETMNQGIMKQSLTSEFESKTQTRKKSCSRVLSHVGHSSLRGGIYGAGVRSFQVSLTRTEVHHRFSVAQPLSSWRHFVQHGKSPGPDVLRSSRHQVRSLLENLPL